MDSSRNCCEPPATSSVANKRPTSSKRSDSFCRRWRMDSFMAELAAAFSGMSAVCDKLRNAHHLRRLYSAGVSMINCVRNLTTVLCASVLAASLLAGCAGVRPATKAAPPPPPEGEVSALTVTAEVALKRGDCRGASDAYAHGAAVAADAQPARRAPQGAMACEDLPRRRAAATPWRAL